ncbi:MAG: TonB-dependent receptor [Bacteroidia bacterium]
MDTKSLKLGVLKVVILYFLLHLSFLSTAQQKTFTVSGFVKDAASKELLIGASIAVPKLKNGTITNNYGFYSLTLPFDTVEILVSYVGFKPKAFKLNLNTESTELNIFLDEINELSEVVVSAEKQYQKLADKVQMSVIEIPVQQIKDIPALLGEKDVLKVIQLLPGVQKGGEGNSGIYVRGGGPDQNLIILDDAIVYNAFHLFGFFSLFNGDALKNVTLTKGGFPARYGGRLSSVIDMSMKEGNKQKIAGEAGVGLISSKLLLEGPIVKDKSSFIVSGRRTYIDLLLKPLLPQETTFGYYFYDLNAKANYEFDDKNRLYVSGYFGRDKFYFGFRQNASNRNDGGLQWGNATATARFNHVHNPKMFSNTSLIFSNFLFGIYQNSIYAGNKFSMRLSSGITDYTLKHDIDYRPNLTHNIRAGVQFINHIFTPSAFVIKDEFLGEFSNQVTKISSIESGVYVEDEIRASSRLTLNPGLRLSAFIVKDRQYNLPEPRFSSSYKLNNNYTVKGSYAEMNQFVHLLSNTGAGLPTDLWVPSSKNLKPQNSKQVAGGITKDFIDKNLSVSIEGYYKESQNIIAYKEGASFLGIDDDFTNSRPNSWEEQITSGRGWSYGFEFLVQRKIGKLSGWVGYTLSWTQLQFDELNFGRKFWARYDRRHDISVVGIYEIKKATQDEGGIKFSATWVYGTGNAITLPIAEYVAPIHNPGRGLDLGGMGGGFFGNYISHYTDRNMFRMAPYHRLDVGIQFVKHVKTTIRTFEVSAYNAYNRYNPYFYYIGYDDFTGNRVLKQVSLFPFLPSISYSVKF